MAPPLQTQRAALLPACKKLFFAEAPMHIVSASGQYLTDSDGRRYLDTISNVQHVGHANPRVAKAIYYQSMQTNCNIRFLNATTLDYLTALRSHMPSGLCKFFLGNSGSEANDLCMRIATQLTGGTEFIVLEHAYHGHLHSVMRLSPYKFHGTGGSGTPPGTHVAPIPDVYRGKYRLCDEELNDRRAQIRIGQQYADEVRAIVRSIERSGKKVAGFFMEALVSCGGQVIPPLGYMDAVAEIIRQAGGLFVMDEVQTGFGRSGSHFWAHQACLLPDSTLVPDLMTIGKPMGNGFPISATVTTDAIADRFARNGMEYFNTYGGNPVAGAAAMAVLREIEERGLQSHAQRVGELLGTELRRLQRKHACVGDVRGVGLFWGVDLVSDRESRRPAEKGVVNGILQAMRDRGVIVNSEGPHGNVIKVKPPMVFSEENVLELAAKLDEVLRLNKSKL